MFMKTTTKTLVLLGVAMPLLLVNAAEQANPGARPATPKISDLFTNSIVAKGAGLTITRAQLDEEVIRVKSQVAAQGGQAPPDLDAQVLDGMIKKQLILSKATPAD